MLTRSTQTKLLLVATLTAASSFSSPAHAVPIVIGVFDTRGECEETAAHEINFIRGLDRFGPGDRDDVNRRAHAALSCEEAGDSWLLVRDVPGA
jgi:hypothetical protein